MKLSVPLALIACTAIGAPLPVAAAETALSQVASQLGYSYAYIGVANTIMLTRPGVTVVIRPGETLIDVNDKFESIDRAPRQSHHDLYVSDELVSRLRQIATRYPDAVAPAAAVVPVKVASGAISVSLSQVPGQSKLAVSGTAPASAPITLTLLGTFSKELPDVVISRRRIAADAAGRFETVVPAAAGHFHGGLLTLVASSLPGVTTARAQFVLKAPNGSIPVPADELPRSVR